MHLGELTFDISIDKISYKLPDPVEIEPTIHVNAPLFALPKPLPPVFPGTFTTTFTAASEAVKALAAAAVLADDLASAGIRIEPADADPLEIFAHLSHDVLVAIERVMADPATYGDPQTNSKRTFLVRDGEFVWLSCPLGIPLLLDRAADYHVAFGRSFMPGPGDVANWAVRGHHTDLGQGELIELAGRFMSAWDGQRIDRVQVASHLGARLAVCQA